MLYDLFICHASEDKDDFVRPLAENLRANHLDVWYDEFSLIPGRSIRQAIDLGLAKSRFGIVVLSTNFFNKEWPQWELDGLVQDKMIRRQKLYFRFGMALLKRGFSCNFSSIGRYKSHLLQEMM